MKVSIALYFANELKNETMILLFFAFIKQHKTLRIGILFVLGVLEKRVHFAHVNTEQFFL